MSYFLRWIFIQNERFSMATLTPLWDAMPPSAIPKQLNIHSLFRVQSAHKLELSPSTRAVRIASTSTSWCQQARDRQVSCSQSCSTFTGARGGLGTNFKAANTTLEDWLSSTCKSNGYYLAREDVLARRFLLLVWAWDICP